MDTVETAPPADSASSSTGTETVKVYTRHRADCPQADDPQWRRCRCWKYLYLYRNGKDRAISAKTRSWETADRKARELLDSWDPVRRLQRELEQKLKEAETKAETSLEYGRKARPVLIVEPVYEQMNLYQSHLMRLYSEQPFPTVSLPRPSAKVLCYFLYPDGNWYGVQPSTFSELLDKFFPFGALNFGCHYGATRFRELGVLNAEMILGHFRAGQEISALFQIFSPVKSPVKTRTSAYFPVARQSPATCKLLKVRQQGTLTR